MKLIILFTLFLLSESSFSQSLDTATYRIKFELSDTINHFFKKDPLWRGADGAASVDLGNGKVLWLFSDTFIGSDSSGSRKESTIIRNSIAIQDGYDLKTASVKYYWNNSQKKAHAFFKLRGKSWFWTGHGIKIKDKLLIFLIKEHPVKTGLGFEAIGWYAVLISNLGDDPNKWKMKYIEGPETFGTIAGSAAVLKDQNFLYAFGAVEPATHEVHLLRWRLTDAYNGNLSNPEWWINKIWSIRNSKLPIPQPLFIGSTEYSVHYDSSINKFIQVQSFGFGEGKIGLRMADTLTGPWTEPIMIYTPTYPGVKMPFIYSAKAHPEIAADGIYITYNVNSFDFKELVDNQNIYFPKFILVKFQKRD